jgi:amino acid adenylation domain-containing protein
MKDSPEIPHPTVLPDSATPKNGESSGAGHEPPPRADGLQRLNGRSAGLSSDRQALLALKLKALKEAKRNKPAPPSVADAIPRRPERGTAPLSFAQELLWLVDQLSPDGFAYNVPRAMKVEGPLDVDALRRAIEAVIERHEVLRTSITIRDGGPVQVIAPPSRVELPQADLTNHPRAEAEVERLIREAALRPFDLARDLMLQAKLIRLGETEHVLIINLHHIVSDGFSKGIMFRDLSAYYGGFTTGRPPALPELPIQYADYAAWQRERMQGEVYDRLLAYWKRKLAHAPALLELPTDRPRPPVQSYRGSHRRRDLPQRLLAGFKELARERKATMFMVLLAAYKAFLSRYTGQHDIVIGTPIADRDHPEVAGLMGFFINTMVLRTDLAGDPTMRELIDRVRDTALDGYDHQEMPFDKLVIELKPERDLSYTPVIQSLFSVGHVKGGHVQDLVPELPGLTLTRMSIDRGSAKFDFTLGVTEGPDWLVMGCEYNTDLFDLETIDRMLEHFEILLGGVVADPGQRISKLPVMSDAERRRVLVEWNDTFREMPRWATIPRCFEAQAERTPKAFAVVAAEKRLTYRELNARANQLARFLRKRGVGPEVPVGIAIGRSTELAVAILGVLKAGGMCVPLDPAYPPERLGYMLSDCRASTLITLARLRPLVSGSAADVVCLDSGWRAIAGESDENLVASTLPEQAAYVIYTSGSTGIPKGVVLTHGGLINHTLAAIDLYGITPRDRVLQFASLSFDISLEELFPSWCAGATVVFRPDDATLASQSLSSWLDREGITVVDLPTSFWQDWVYELSARKEAAPRSLRLVIVGGEKATAQAYSIWLERGGRGIRWINTYGPTEASVIATAYEPSLAAQGAMECTDPPIGRPIANTQVYILDGQRQPVPIGVPGELYIGGVGLARGYLNRDDLTQERFIGHPFSDQPGARLYRTGDRARWRSDGVIEFAGRVDDQVKIRGFRIEPGEIEAALVRIPGVRQAAVAVGEDRPGAKFLVAYVASDAVPAAAPKALKEELARTLPEYMIPTSFVMLPSLPLLPNGKIDRRALPLADAARHDAETGFVAPHSPIEKGLAKIWCEILGLEQVGIRDDFFQVGGHSLLVLRLWSRVKEAFGQDYPINLFFQHRTIEQMAAVLRQSKMVKPEFSDQQSTSAANGRKPLLFCVNDEGALAQYLDDIPIYPLGFYTDEVLIWGLDSVEALAPIYIKRLRQQQPRGPYRLAGFCGSALIAFEMARQLRVEGDEVPLLVLMEPRGLRPSPAQSTQRRMLTIRYALIRLRHHLASLGAVPIKSWPDYVLARVRTIVGRAAVKLKLRQSWLEESGFWQERLWLRRALASYKPGIYPGKVTLFLASQRAELHNDSDFGWSGVAGGGLDVHLIPGSHHSLTNGPDIQLLCQEIKDVYFKHIQDNEGGS